MRVQRRRIEQDGGLSGGLFEGQSYVFHHLLGIFVKHGIVLHDQEAVMVLLQNGHELEEGVGPADLQLGEVAIQAAENAGVVATDKKDLVALYASLGSILD